MSPDIAVRHPPGHRLEEIAVGGQDLETQQHLEGCAECRQYVERAATAARQFAVAGGEGRSVALAADTGERLARERMRRHRLRWRAVVGGGLGALAAAAAALIIVVARPQTPATVFKGGAPQLAVVVERAGVQARSTAAVAVRGGDRLRVEVSVDEGRTLGVAFLGRDGTWVLLLAPRRLDPGTHWSEQALRFDDRPTPGWIIAGSPEALEQARARRVDGPASDLAALEVRVDPGGQ